MECFRNYVGLRGCSTVAPLSGFYINSLAGINLPMMEGISSEEQRNYAGVFRDVQDRSLLRIEADILNHLQPTIRIPKVSSLETIGQFDKDLVYNIAPGKLAGIYFELLYSEYLGIKFEDITVYSQIVQDIELKLWDVSSGTVLTTIAAHLVTGANLIPVNREYFNTPGNNRFFLAYDTAQTQLAHTNANRTYPYMDTFSNQECFHNCPWDYGYGYPNIFGAYAASAGPINTHTVHTSAETGGLVVRFQICCSLSAFVCRIRERFRQAYAYLLGSEMVLEMLLSTRFNEHTVTRRDDYKKLRDEYEALFDAALKTALASVDLPDDFCFQCEPRVSTQILGF